VGKRTDETVIDLLTVSATDVALVSWLKPYQGNELVLSISKQHCLIKAITLPAQAEANLAEMVQFEVDRQTPFSFDQVYVGYHVNELRGDDKSLSLQLAVIPKKVVTPRIDKLAALSLPIKSLQISPTTVTDSEIKITLAEDDNIQDVSTVHFKINCLLMALALMLLMALLYSPVIKYENAIKAIQPALAEAKKQALVVNNLKKDNTVIAEQIQFIEDRLTKYRPRINILAELAKVLPKHTWLEQSEIRGNTLSIRGESSAVAELVELLTDTGHFGDVRLAASTTHNERSGTDRFKIQAVLLTEDKLHVH
jgi:general secretion pathway protein L